SKLILIFSAIIMFFMAFVFMNFYVVGAEESSSQVNGSGIFQYTSNGTETPIETDGNGNMNISVVDGTSFEFKRKLVVNDFEMGIILSENILKANINFKSENALANSDEVNNILVLELDSNKNLLASYNGSNSPVVVATNYNNQDVIAIGTTVEAGVLNITVNNMVINAQNTYKIESEDKATAKISFELDLVDAENGQPAITSNLKIRYVGQKASTSSIVNGELQGAYLQTFVVGTDGKLSTALPRLELDNGTIHNGKVIRGLDYSLSFAESEIYYVYKLYNDTDILLSVKDGVDARLDKTSKNVSFVSVTNDCEFYFTDKADNVIETYKVAVVEKSSDTTAPQYNLNADAKATFINKIQESLIYSKEGGKIVYVPVGADKSLTLPSMKDLVSDDLTAYEKLSGKLYYCLPESTVYTTKDFSSLKSSPTIPLTRAGEYKFYVMFKDAQGNSMQIEDFYVVDEDDSNIITEKEYYGYIFSFTVLDNYPVSVTASTSKKSGYLNTKFTAPSFTIVAGENPIINYTLFYSETNSENEEDWVEIPRSIEVTEDYNKDGFTYADLKEISYDGKLSFTPDRIGYYKIKCNVVATNAFSSEASIVVDISNKPIYVKPASDWLQNNVWSVVFLSVGTLCLAGIIVLLCIKPKDKNEDN
ncbi:MAG: hypothetical protein IKA99_08465, partial [Clostridia bacterium]|nr:hypothetical protein [Clostridia bacterium]